MGIETAKRIVVSTQSPTASPVPSTDPTEFPTISSLPTYKVEEPTTFVYNTMAPTMKVVEPILNESSNDNIIYITVILVVSVLIIAILIFFYCRLGQSIWSDEVDIKGTDTKAEDDERSSDPERGVHLEDDGVYSKRDPPPEAFGTLETITIE